jgi:hypothetical protein
VPPPTAALDSGVQLSAYEKDWLLRLSWIQLQEIIPNDLFVMDSGYHDDEERVAMQ